MHGNSGILRKAVPTDRKTNVSCFFFLFTVIPVDFPPIVCILVQIKYYMNCMMNIFQEHHDYCWVYRGRRSTMY